ncbi:hypothetical protein CLAFUW4_06462 [Fulvia fulva]|uniref:BTB domain-containing protein n=1 Tax=Passalora fulva TaxID=5499 RepID=A0A9Q8LHH4_PASFU|nr:uncharacterized protein CLAFUR5_06606 [Fulvia fulva]KAK4625973.1 hypothetical protein CLAFUR0_06467 [Fulvia fulva]UJO17527.1 hypothetical protein CLAFUR5_06606 [Fulvia fulva]WPV14834.1 hypothetical protein CLAFUW4_06462 [Fulvia fulva]WPV30086.1 hypothetical protein CLAFUW7_06462 [Fulvia fulva]
MSTRHDRFPDYRDGDVKLTLTSSRRYKLHSGVLRNNSPVMREMLDERDAAQLDRKAQKNGITTRFKLVLVENPLYTDGDDELSRIEFVFEAVPLGANGQPLGANLRGVGDGLENGRVVPEVFLAYDAVLGAFYNVPIQLGDAQSDGLTHLLSMALQITSVAEYLDCVHIITKPIEATLLATGQHLLKAIANNPTAWLSFAHRIRSKSIFRESLIHASGQYMYPSVQTSITSGELPDEVVSLLKQKAATIIDGVRTCERHLASYYPTILMREKTVGRVDRDNIGRANYANDIIMWIALCIFRHWASDMMASDQTHHAKDMGFAFIHAVARGGDAYLAKSVLHEQFHLRFPMSPKGMACTEHRLAEIKEVVKQWTVPLMRNESHLDRKANPQKHFLFTVVRQGDYPWGGEGEGGFEEEDEF